MTQNNNRKNWSTKGITLQERYKIRLMLNQGYKILSISKLMGRGFSTIGREIRRGGGKNKYDPIHEHEQAGKRHAMMGRCKRKKPQSTSECKQIGNVDIENRLRNLEMQVEILAETCKKLMRSKTQ